MGVLGKRLRAIGLALTVITPLGCATTATRSQVKTALAGPVAQAGLDRGEMVEWKFHYQKIAFLGPRARQVRETQKLVDRIVAASAKPDTAMIVRVQSDAVPHAFAPGGRYLYVTTRLLDDAESLDELAFVLAHEIAHVHLDHLGRSRTTEIFAATTTAFSSVIAAMLQRDDAALAASAYARFGGLIPIKHDRDHESEADALGTVYAARAGFDASRARDFLLRSGGQLLAMREEAVAQRAAASDQLKETQAGALRDAIGHSIAPHPRSRTTTQAQRQVIAKRQLQLSEADLLYHWGSSHPEPGTRLGNIDAVLAFLANGTVADDAPGQVKDVLGALGDLPVPAPAANPGSLLRVAQQRLNDQGFGCGAADGQLGTRTRTCLRAFQQKEGLADTGALDQPTLLRLGFESR